eukprot:490840_1
METSSKSVWSNAIWNMNSHASHVPLIMDKIRELDDADHARSNKTKPFTVGNKKRKLHFSNMFTNTNHNGMTKTYSRGNIGGKYRSKKRKSDVKHLSFGMRSAPFDSLPHPPLACNEEKEKEINNFWSSDLADFVQETDQQNKKRKMSKVQSDTSDSSSDIPYVKLLSFSMNISRNYDEQSD